MQEESTHEAPNQQTSIFDDEFINTEEYDKKIKSARTAIFVVAAVQFVFGLVTAFSSDGLERNVEIGLTTLIALIFTLLGFWCKKKPFAAIVTALTLYAALLLLDFILDPATIVKGIIMKILIIGYLAKGIGAAREAEKIKKMMGGE